MGIVVYNGLSSEDLGIVVEHPPKYHYPQRDYEITHVPGRNGDVVFDNGSYQNVIRRYELAIGDFEHDYTTLVNRISEWLHSASGYARLEDTYEPDYFRQAMYIEEGEIENYFGHAGRITVEFNCKPQRFLKAGEETHIITQPNSILINPTRFESKPLLKIYGNGPGIVGFSFESKDSTRFPITINSISEYVVIDCDLQDAYKGTENKNSTIQLSSNGFPKLGAGINTISFEGNITKVEVIPRWWTL